MFNADLAAGIWGGTARLASGSSEAGGRRWLTIQPPPHYTAHPSGVECITIAEHMGFCLGNVLKYIWRADMKGRPIEDLYKARYYLEREIARRESEERMSREARS